MTWETFARRIHRKKAPYVFTTNGRARQIFGIPEDKSTFFLVEVTPQANALGEDLNISGADAGSEINRRTRANACHTKRTQIGFIDGDSKFSQGHTSPNVTTKIGDGYQGWIEYAPFDAIIVTAAPNHIPPALIEQLKPNGRMVIPVGELTQDLILVTKGPDGRTINQTIVPVKFVPLTRGQRNPQ